MKREVKSSFLTAVTTIAILAAVTVVVVVLQREFGATARCEENMRLIRNAALAYLVENEKPITDTVDPAELSAYTEIGICPLGDKPYAPFTLMDGPRCPNSAKHTDAFLGGLCLSERDALWDAAILYAAKNGLSWDSVIEPEKVYDSPYVYATAMKACPLSKKAYAPFVLREGPKCPNSNAHNKLKPNLRYRRNAHFFDRAGNVRTDMPLSEARTYVEIEGLGKVEFGK